MHDQLPILENRLMRTYRERILPAETVPLRPLKIGRFDLTDDPGETATPAHPRNGVPGQGEPISFQQLRPDLWPDDKWQPAHEGDAWGPAWGTTWFSFEATVTEDDVAAWPGGLELNIDLGWEDHSPGFQAEGLVYDEAGKIIKALNPKNQWVPCPATPGKHRFFVEASAVPLLLGVPPFIPTQEGRKTTASPKPIYALRTAQLVGVDQSTRRLGYRLEAIAQLGAYLGEDDSRRWQIATVASAALDKLDLHEGASVRATAGAADQALQELYDLPAAPGEHEAWAVGHAHIDSAWLWPLRETRRKCVRTFANVVRLLEDGADFVFALPAAQHAAWVAQDAPELFERIKQWVAKGKIVPVGGMWVEPDAVLPSGESVCRQLLLGQSFFKENFGKTCPQVWLPDSFGYAGSLPQLAKAGGAQWFLTQKISWNQVDKFPHHTMLWEGIDGTRLFTHFPPADTYGSDLSAQNLLHTRNNFKDKGRAGVSLVPFGYGDGGGGPTREMIQRGALYADLAGAPKIHFEGPDQFYQAAVADYPNPQVWSGELYLELHRGTFTSQADTKAGNRLSESLIRQAEMWSVLAALYADLPYPAQQLRQAWQQICLYQFHDILPGTSIGWVYDQVKADYQQLHRQLRQIIEGALAALAACEPCPPEASACCVVANPTPFVAEVAGTPLPPATLQLRPREENSAAPQVTCESQPDGTVVLQNQTVRAVVAPGAVVTSLVDLSSGREVVPPGQVLGTFSLYQDFPNMWDAWDVDVFYRGSRQVFAVEQPLHTSQNAVSAGRSFGHSQATLKWSLEPVGGLKLQVDVDWHESEKFLKLDLPLDVQTERAAWETQMGHVWRPLHQNTSWDAYRFEVNAHRWAYLEEPGFGVAIANKRTYGWDARREERPGGGVFAHVGASLLRAPRYPDPTADRGHHTFEFQILPGCNLSDAVQLGYRLNTPIQCVSPGSQETAAASPQVIREYALPITLGPQLAIEAVKLAEDGADVIVRAYEYLGARAQVKYQLAPGWEVSEVDVLERPISQSLLPAALDTAGGCLRVHPFQVVTLRLHRN